MSYGVSADGSVVVGSSSFGTSGNPRWRAFRWTASGGMQNLETPPWATRSYGYAVSADGSVVVGQASGGGPARAVRWTAAAGWQDLGTLPPYTESYAWGVSADGSVVVGYSGDRAFRWTAAGGMQDLGTVSGTLTSYAYGVSADGSVVVGYSWSDVDGDLAFRWTEADGMQRLGALPGGSHANGVSADGSVVVGFSGERAFRWTLWTAPTLSQQPDSAALCRTSATVFSVAATGTEPLTYQWQWRPAPNAPWVDVVDGVNADPANGPTRFIASGARSPAVTVRPEGGTGTAGSHWEKRCIVTNPCGSTPSNPATVTYCPVDVNCVNGVTVQDIFDFLAAWFGGNIAIANFNGDCCITVQDLFDFLAAWFQGC